MDNSWFACEYCRSAFRATDNTCPYCGAKAVEYHGKVRTRYEPSTILSMHYVAIHEPVSTSSAVYFTEAVSNG